MGIGEDVSDRLFFKCMQISARLLALELTSELILNLSSGLSIDNTLFVGLIRLKLCYLCLNTVRACAGACVCACVRVDDARTCVRVRTW